MYYTIRRINLLEFELAKFDGSAQPLDVYRVYNGNCSCPARVKNCKHIKMIDRWVNEFAEEPGLLLDEDMNYQVIVPIDLLINFMEEHAHN